MAAEVERLLSGLGSASGQVAKGQTLLRQIDGEQAARLQELQKTVPLEVLLQPGELAGKLPPEVDAKWREFQAVRAKQEVLPGVIHGYEAKVQEAEEEVRRAVSALRGACARMALQEEESLAKEVTRRAMALTEGNAAASREIADFVVSRCMARRYHETFCSLGIEGDVSAGAKETLVLAKRFLSRAAARAVPGKSTSSAAS